MKWFLLAAAITAGVFAGTMLAIHSATLYARGRAAVYKGRKVILALLLVPVGLSVLGVLYGGVVEVNANMDRAATHRQQLAFEERLANDAEPCRSLDALDAAVETAMDAAFADNFRDPVVFPIDNNGNISAESIARRKRSDTFQAAVQRANAARDAAYAAAGNPSCAWSVHPLEAATIWEIDQMRLWEWLGWRRTWD
jgi:hypothetical protein